MSIKIANIRITGPSNSQANDSQKGTLSLKGRPAAVKVEMSSSHNISPTTVSTNSSARTESPKSTSSQISSASDSEQSNATKASALEVLRPVAQKSTPDLEQIKSQLRVRLNNLFVFTDFKDEKLMKELYDEVNNLTEDRIDKIEETILGKFLGPKIRSQLNTEIDYLFKGIGGLFIGSPVSEKKVTSIFDMVDTLVSCMEPTESLESINQKANEMAGLIEAKLDGFVDSDYIKQVKNNLSTTNTYDSVLKVVSTFKNTLLQSLHKSKISDFSNSLDTEEVYNVTKSLIVKEFAGLLSSVELDKLKSFEDKLQFPDIPLTHLGSVFNTMVDSEYRIRKEEFNYRKQ